MSRIITGLDIGSSTIKGLVVERRPDGILSVLSAFTHPSLGFRKGALVDVEAATHVLRDVSVQLRKISSQATRNVFVNVNSEQVRARLSRGITAVSRGDQEIQQEDIDRVLQASRAIKSVPNFQVLHNITREYFVDDVGDIQDALNMTGNRLEVSTLIVEIFAPHLNVLSKALERVGVSVGGVIFNPLSAARSVLSKQQKELGVLLIDLGFGTTSVVAYEEGKVTHTRSFPIGGSHITNDIAIGLKTSVDVAEKLKTMYGFALARDANRRDLIQLSEFDPTHSAEISRRFLGEIIEVRLVELFQIIYNDLKESLGRIPQLPGGVVLTGGGVRMAGLTDLVRQEMKLSVQIGLPNFSEFDIMNPVHQEMLDNPDFAVASGLVLLSADEETHTSFSFGTFFKFFRNLIP